VSGLERIDAAFAAARDEGRAALMPYLVGGFPDIETSRRVAHAYAEAGADLIELGVPYSDPLADGPVIHAAATEALNAGATLAGVMTICADVTAAHPELPVLPMVYANMALAPGPDGFATMLAESGAAGAIVPDLPPGEDADLPRAMSERGLALIPFVAPTTPPARRQRLVEGAAGFVYVISLTGVTGEREALPAELTDLVAAVRTEAGAPAAVGFGIGTPEKAAEVGEVADGVIIGSRLVRAVADAKDGDGAIAAVTEFLEATRTAMAAPGGRPVG
jgi:tryptophan synthase alpha chain